MDLPRLAITIALLLSFAWSAAPMRAESWHVYFGTGGRETKGIYRATFDSETGRLSAAEVAAEIGSPGFLALHPDGTKLYAVGTTSNGPGVTGYRIGSGGALELINSSPIGDGGGAHVSVHPSGKFVLTAQYGGGSVALFPLDGDGRLGSVKLTEHEGGSRVVPRRQDSPHPHWTGYSPDGRFALVPDLGLDGIVIYRVNTESPSIERHGFAASEAGGGARHMRFSPDGRFIYLLNELTLSLTSFAWDAASGTARQLGTVPSLSEEVKAKEAFNSGAEVLVHPSGRFVYSSNRGNDTVTAYRANPASGELAVIQVQPVRGAFPRNINLSPDGHWLLAAGADSNTVSVHRINQQTGELTFQTGAVINVPSPICILFVKQN